MPSSGLLPLSPDTMAMDMVMVMAMDTDMVAMDITTARDLLSPDTMAMDMVMVMAMDTDMEDMATTTARGLLMLRLPLLLKLLP